MSNFFACFSTPKNTEKNTLLTRTGKDVKEPSASDLYGGSKSTLPPLAVLKYTKPSEFTDLEGRSYWLASDVQRDSQWTWEKGITIQLDRSVFHAETDEIYFVRNNVTRGKTPAVLYNPPPVVSTEVPMLFLQGDSELKGFIVDSGNDELALEIKSSKSFQRSTPRTRSTSYVVIRWTGGKRPGLVLTRLTPLGPAV